MLEVDQLVGGDVDRDLLVVPHPSARAPCARLVGIVRGGRYGAHPALGTRIADRGRLLGGRSGRCRWGGTGRRRRAGSRVEPPLRHLLGQLAVGVGAASRSQAYDVIGSPATVESENFTVRRITVWKTLSPQACTSRSITSRLWRVRPSNIVPSTPSISRSGFSRSRTLSIVVLSSATPRSAKYSHSSGTMHAVGRRQRVHRQQPERGLAVDQDHVVLLDRAGRAPAAASARARPRGPAAPRRRTGRCWRAAGPCPGTPVGTTTSSS